MSFSRENMMRRLTLTTSIHSPALSPSASIIPGQPPVFKITEQDKLLAALVMAWIFFVDVIWCVLMRTRWIGAIVIKYTKYDKTLNLYFLRHARDSLVENHVKLTPARTVLPRPFRRLFSRVASTSFTVGGLPSMMDKMNSIVSGQMNPRGIVYKPIRLY
jgi:hypothetical protein